MTGSLEPRPSARTLQTPHTPFSQPNSPGPPGSAPIHSFRKVSLNALAPSSECSLNHWNQTSVAHASSFGEVFLNPWGGSSFTCHCIGQRSVSQDCSERSEISNLPLVPGFFLEHFPHLLSLPLPSWWRRYLHRAMLLPSPSPSARPARFCNQPSTLADCLYLH